MIQNSVREGKVLAISMPGNKVPEHHYSLCPQKELLVRSITKKPV
jgi:hypothetical protein